ncbi:endonuclease/exonuclease/phosphatase family protein [Echinicola strongylocentroti]|uniref:Endonuclease/exonuclease/phosphatase family protein n=1 Tax=Echinicola strongylocentroti TaxID=1795355 RepID=A0A2Z4IEK2_9BACT|nr:endonuclease/exonuclease/phosphatase family protein [Echinicola strongylocentroti]AWW29354.1 endonuclease/exonuclease/phosphatase family protein [Echinicola strongylocentroti]
MKAALYAFSALLIIATLMPLVKKDYWTFRVFDYPRFQKFLLISAALAGWAFVDYNGLSKVDFGIIIILGILFLHLLKQIIPYSPFHTKMVKPARSREKTSIKVLVSNVYQYNNHYSKCLSLIKKERPDLFMLVETSNEWAKAVSALKESYPYQVELPLENTYGMLLYSRFPLKNTSINYLINEEIPSIFTDLILDGQPIKLFAIHPTPPVPGENTHSTERDAEILIVGKKAKAEKKPTIIMGDLNDVAWSYTTELFLKISGMGDPRRGRGMFNTFHAKYSFLRWPLDHIFVSDQFRLKKIKVHHSIGSDHFPISVELVLDKNNDNEQLEANAEEMSEAKEKIISGIEF